MSSIEAVCDPEQIARSLGAAGIRLAGSGRLRLERAWPHRKGGLSANFRAEDGLWSIHGPAEPPRSALRDGRTIRLPDLGCWAHRFPFDPSLSQLLEQVDATQKPEAANVSTRTSDVFEPRVVSYKPLRRCVLQMGDGRFVKLLRPRAAAEVASIYASIESDPVFGTMRVALPESVDPRKGALVWRQSPGGTLLEGRPPNEIAGLMHRVGHGLGCLQNAGPNWPKHHLASDELSTLERWVSAAAAAFPDVGRTLWTAFCAIADAIPKEEAVQLVPAHRDFHDGQLLNSGKHLTLLDMDTACMAAPELDVANFVAHLRLASLHCARFQWHAAAASFVAGRSQTGATALDTARADWYESTALLRLACVHAFRPRWTQLSDDLAESARCRLAAPSPYEET